MREPRVYTDQPLEPGTHLTLEPAPSHHLLRVLRLMPGDRLRLFNGNGRDYLGRLQSIHQGQAVVDLESLLHEECPSPIRLHLLLGISKGERMDFALQKAVELGVTRLSPLLARRTVVQLQGRRLERRLQHWQQVMIGACEQSGRCRLPHLDPPHSLTMALKTVEGDRRLALDHRGTATLADIPAPTQGIALLIGPEGGLDEGEIQQARGQGFVPLRLGPRILRTETAPLAALAAIQTLWGDFRVGP